MNVLPYILFTLPLIGFEIYKFTHYQKAKINYEYKGVSFIENTKAITSTLNQLQTTSNQQEKQALVTKLHELKVQNKQIRANLHKEL